LGGIVEGQKNLVLWNSPIGEQLTAIKHGNGRDWWIILRKGYPNSSKILSIHLSEDGIVGGGEYDAGFVANQVGELTSSPNGETLAFASGGEVGDAILAIYNFDRCEGEIQLAKLLEVDSLNKGLYGVAFSLSGRNIYMSSISYGKDRHFQVNLDNDSLYALELFRFNFPGTPTTGNMTGQMELGPDGKIYITRSLHSAFPGISSFAEYLGVVQYPDEIGEACELDTFGFYLGGYSNNNTYSLPNFANYDLGPLAGSPCDTLTPQDTTQTGLHNPPLQNIFWSVLPTVGSGEYTVTGLEAGWLVVHDLYGREVLRRWHEERTIFDLTAHPTGLYLVYLRAADGSRSLSRKIVRQ
jgi:WD40 repeat protein